MLPLASELLSVASGGGVPDYLFPNEAHVTWTVMIVLYPYITGLVAGAFIVSSLYHVFGRNEFKPISKFALVASLAFLLFATAPLLNHLGQPQRAFNIVITPNFSSAMAGFGILYTTYLVILTLEVWLVFRPDIIRAARRSRGVMRMVYKTLALGVYDDSPEALAVDHKVIKVLAAIGIPAACGLHGYVGFLFGAIKANPWWSTPLMPIIFLFSAIVSGIAALLVMYAVVSWFRGRSLDVECVRGLTRNLWYFLIIAIILELLEIISLAYEGAEEWEVIWPMLSQKLAFSFFGLQMILGALIPFVLLTIVVLLDRDMVPKTRTVLGFLASILLLIQVLAMRWNVVIGGQMFSKSFHGYRESYVPLFLEKEGIGPGLLIMLAPFVFLYVFSRLLPLFPEVAGAGTGAVRLPAGGKARKGRKDAGEGEDEDSREAAE